MKLTIRLYVLLISTLCGTSQTASSGPVFIMNVANPLFQPQYQLATYTGSLAAPITTQTSNLVVTVNPIFWTSTWGMGQGYKQVTALTAEANTPFYGFLEGSLVANGYMASPLTPSSSLFSLAVSAAFTMGNSSVGLTDLTELCQRYGFVSAFVSMPGFVYGGLARKHKRWMANYGIYNQIDILTFPFTLPLDTASTSNCSGWCTVGATGFPTLSELWFASPIMINGNKPYLPTTHWQYWDTEGWGAASTGLNALSVLPLGTSYKQISNALAWFNQSITEDSILYRAPSLIGQVSFEQQLKALSCEIPYPGTIKKTQAQVTIIQNPISSFNDMHTWLVENIGIAFASPVAPLADLPRSFMTMNGANTTSKISSSKSGLPYNKAYADMLAALSKPAISVQLNPSTISSVAIPGASTSAISTTLYFDTLGVYLPLLMADPCSTMQTNTSQTVSPYYYPGMVAYTWVRKQGRWTIGNGATQQINYSGGQQDEEFGAIKETDFDPQKSMMTDFYSILSF